MTEFIKKFIEENIDAIENNDWESVFCSWCDESLSESWERIYYQEFLSVLDSSGVHVDESAIPEGIKQNLRNYLEEEKEYEPEAYFSNSGLVSCANRLGISKQYAQKIVDELVSELNMVKTSYNGSEGYSWQ